MFQCFEEIAEEAGRIGPQRVVVLFPGSPDVMNAVGDGVSSGMIEPVLVGEREKVLPLARAVGIPETGFEFIDRTDPQEAADLCLDMVARGDVAFAVKGKILTTYLYRSLIRVTKMLAPEQTPCTLCFHQVPAVGKLFAVSDPGVNILPDLETKQKILQNALSVLRQLGLQRPRVMALAAPRQDHSDSPALRDAAALRQKALRGEFGACEVVEETHLLERFRGTPIDTERFPDFFLVPNIETGNLLVKSIDHLGGGVRQCVTVGGGVFVLTPSRSDDAHSRRTILALGAVLADRRAEERRP